MAERHRAGAQLPGTRHTALQVGTLFSAVGAVVLAVAACGNQASNDRTEGDIAASPAGEADSTLPSGELAPEQQAEMRAAPALTVGADAMQGRVYLTGSSPNQMVSIQADDDRSVRLAGDLEAEMGRLSGAIVRVQGTVQGQGAMRSFDVRAYEVLDIDGVEPLVGVLQEVSGHLMIATDPPLTLQDPPQGLAAMVGAKIWIVGRVEVATVHVQSFGIIRDP
ncbi:MAG: hypothetical protein AMS18_13380 [Gemmatimonas sp. SG8_17]|nr:MAG: hypothetical protein AMS18_13380 [Gemmatimonas sp. SG8_17]